MTLNLPITLNPETPIILLSPQPTFTLGANDARFLENLMTMEKQE